MTIKQHDNIGLPIASSVVVPSGWPIASYQYTAAMSSIADALYEALMDVETTGAFATGGKLEGCPMPGLVVDGVGAIALPLHPDQAKSLTEHSVQAPFGRGAETVVDTAVRLCRQVEPTKIQLSAAWNAYIQKRATEYVTQLGVSSDNVEARLYKLVLYEEGGFFKSHKDTEKEPGMFGSLVVQLPAKHDAGTLAVRHRGDERLFDFSNDSDSYFYAAAFYTDCEHELHPVTNGMRLCLLYNLVRVGGDGPLPSLAERDAQCDQLLQIATQWEEDPDAPEKLCLALDHEYTTKNLAFRKLKGADKERVDALLQSKCFDLHLALIEKHMRGDAEYEHGSYSYNRYGYDSDEGDSEDSESGCGRGGGGKHHIMEDCHESSTRVYTWINVQDTEVTMKGLDIYLDEEILNAEEALFDSDAEPDKEEYESYMGNYGPTVEYWYHRAVLVIWPRSMSVRIVCNSSFEAAIQLVQQRVTSKANDALNTLKEVVEYATGNSNSAHAYYLAPLLQAACTMKQPKFVLDVMQLLCKTGTTADRNEAMLDAIHLLGWNTARSSTLAAVLATPCDRLQHAATLALKLERLGTTFKEAAAFIAQEVAKKYVGYEVLNSISAATVSKMLFCFPCCSEQRAVFVARATELSTPALASVLQTLNSMHGGQQMPDEFTSLASSYMSRTFSNYNTSEGNSNHNVAVFAILLNNNDEEMLEGFVRSVCATKDANLLQALTKSCLNMPQNKHVRMLAAARAAQLRYPKPTYSNQQPYANVPNHPQVTYFLRSDQTTLKYSNFNNLEHARNFGRKHFGGYNQREHHCARADADGRGSNAYVTITKTKDYYNTLLAKFQRDQAELQSLQPLLDEPIVQESKRQKTNDDGSSENSVIDLTDE